MTEIHARNVQEAYCKGLAALRQRGVWEDTRNGRALVYPEPVMTVYERPLERFLLDPVRDANPFFHVLEALWMLAGRNDVASLEPFNRGLKQYSDDGENYHGAYGHRWRHHFGSVPPSYSVPGGGDGTDQLQEIIELLRRDPSTRRAVLAMWDPCCDLGGSGLDYPCNTHIYFRVRNPSKTVDTQEVPSSVLDMMVNCRSNDAIFGAYGANAVHFSVLQEFVASAVGVAMGRMHQNSFNFHAYEDQLERVGQPEMPYEGDQVFKLFDRTDYDRPDDPVSAHHLFVPYGQGARIPVEAALLQIENFWDDHLPSPLGLLVERGLSDLIRVREAYLRFRARDRFSAMEHATRIQASDMRRACVQWLERRYADAG